MAVPYYGDFLDNDTVNIPFNTFDSNDPSNSVTATDLILSDIYVHKDGSATAITTDGATVDVDAPGVGAHMITIDTNADAAYVTGSEYAVRVDGVTVDGGTVNAWVGAFSIERAGGALAQTLLLSAKLDSDMVLVVADHDKTQSDIAVIDAAIDSDALLFDADHDKTQSDIALIDAAIDSDMVLVIADHDATQSDIVLISSKLDSDMTLVLAQHTKTQSDIVILDDFLDTEMASQTSNLVIIASDTVAIEADTNSLNDGAISELGVAAPSATPTLQNAVMLLYMALRNKTVVQTSATDALEIYNDAGVKIAIKLITDDGSDYTEAEMSTGA